MIFTAFAGDEEVFSPSLHSREDLVVFSVRVKGEEGDVQEIDLEVLNTREAYATRRIFVSKDGNLIGVGYITSNIGQIGETMTVQIVCKPDDYDDKQYALCQELKEDEQNRFNEIAIPKASIDDISEILAGFPWVLDWNPETHEVEAVDIFEPGGGNLNLVPFHNSISSSYIEPPSSVKVKATAQWSQTYIRSLSPGDVSNGIMTMTPEGLVQGWPKVGEYLGDGILVKESLAREKIYAIEAFQDDINGEPIRQEVNVFLDKGTDDFNLDPEIDENETQVEEKAYVSTMDTVLNVEHFYEVRRTEECELSVSANLQQNLKLGAGEEIQISVQELVPEPDFEIRDWVEGEEYRAGDRVEVNGRLYGFHSRIIAGPIFDEKAYGISPREYTGRQALRYASSFFRTEIGNSFAEYMLNRAKARLKHTGRCFRISFDCEIPENPADVRTNKTATINSPTLVGGTATGKIVDYVMNYADGDSYMTVTIACAPGISELDTLMLEDGSYNFESGESEIGVLIENVASSQITEFTKPRLPELPQSDKIEEINKPRFTTETEEEDISDYYAGIQPTKITYSAIIPNNDLSGTAEFPISGILTLPQQVTI